MGVRVRRFVCLFAFAFCFLLLFAVHVVFRDFEYAFLSVASCHLVKFPLLVQGLRCRRFETTRGPSVPVVDFFLKFSAGELQFTRVHHLGRQQMNEWVGGSAHVCMNVCMYTDE